MSLRRVSVWVVWLATLIGAIYVAMNAQGEQLWLQLSLVLGSSIMLCFVVQLSLSKKRGLIDRIMTSIVGSVIIVFVVAIFSLIRN